MISFASALPHFASADVNTCVTTTTTSTTPFPSPVPLLSPPFASAAKAAESPHTQHTSKCCTYCFTRTTPMWRHGPVNFNPLCNGCGVKWKRGRILVGQERAPKEQPPSSHSHQPNKKQKVSSQPPKRSPSDASFTSTFPTCPSNVKVPRCLLNANLTTPLDFTQTPFIEAPSYIRPKSLSPTLESTLPPTHTSQVQTRQQMLLESTFARSPPPSAISTSIPRSEHISDDRRQSISSPVDLQGPSLRSAFVCAALETLDSKGGALRKVADAVLWIRRRSFAGEKGESVVGGCVDGELGEEEGEVDVGALGVEDWEYLCRVLVSVE
ncbi:hypothetical protein HDU98_003712 [Podochytrium sp. JEL0797]|nr:hypothetical protein HDU98_003712 [Podochytrium sp. JEL0797]